MIHLVPIYQDEANAFVKMFHRHHKPVVGSIFQIACAANYDACDIETREEIIISEIVGVAIVGRPVSRHEDSGWTLEVTRLCTDGTPHVCSKLYAAAWRIAREMAIKG
jgi:hypothetical protein